LKIEKFMKLYIDTSSSKETQVVLGGKKLVRRYLRGHSQVVLPMIKKALGKRGVGMIKEITVKTTGESFTGLRVGAAIANALNFALGRRKKIIVPRYD
jgi:tRNA A37 threonylcarbamoyladenosine modification protein TsaB